MRISFLITLAVCTLCACNGSTDHIKSGDLIFLTAGGSQFSDAIASATANNSPTTYDHVAIIEVDSDGKLYVLEATPHGGVQLKTWSQFTAAINQSSPTAYKIMRVADGLDLASTLANAKSHLGKPYDWEFAPGDSALYCSELVQISYVDAQGLQIFETQAMNFLDSQGNMPQYWLDLFDGQVPQGTQGTNPNDMSQSARLIDVAVTLP